MSKFEYRITKHAAAEFDRLAFFCSENGECGLDEVPEDQMKALEDMLNEYGMVGWELVNLAFGRNGILAFWKKKADWAENIVRVQTG